MKQLSVPSESRCPNDAHARPRWDRCAEHGRGAAHQVTDPHVGQGTAGLTGTNRDAAIDVYGQRTAGTVRAAAAGNDHHADARVCGEYAAAADTSTTALDHHADARVCGEHAAAADTTAAALNDDADPYIPGW